MSFHRTKDIKSTRAAHMCHGCVTRFPAGSSLQYNSGAAEYGYYDYYLCMPCSNVVAKYWDEVENDGVFEFGAIKELIYAHQVENQDQLIAALDAQKTEMMRLRKLSFENRNKNRAADKIKGMEASNGQNG